MDNNEDTLRHFSVSELRELFKLETTESDTHNKLKCKRCLNKIQIKNPPEEADCTSDLANWYHSWDKRSLADTVSYRNTIKKKFRGYFYKFNLSSVGFKTNLGCFQMCFVCFPSKIRLSGGETHR